MVQFNHETHSWIHNLPVSAVTCMYEEALPKGSYNIKENFTIRYRNGSTDAKNKLDPILYPYLTNILYDCIDSYQTVTATPSQNITCGSFGRWTPQLSGCLSEFLLRKINIYLLNGFLYNFVVPVFS